MPELPINHGNEDEETLVAYLDGELDPQSEQLVLERLSLDAHARAKVDALRRAWDLLDYLPRPEPSASFTSQTLERISGLRPAVAASPRPAQPAQWWRPWAFGLAWVALLFLASALGFVAMRYFLNKSREVNLDELLVPYVWVIENEHLYQHVDDVHFLKQLAAPELFGDER
jgi:anti-sigma factor RsiW